MGLQGAVLMEIGTGSPSKNEKAKMKEGRLKIDFQIKYFAA